MGPGWTSGEISTIGQLLQHQADRVGDKVAITAEGQHVTYGELLSRATGFANGLHELGVRPGEVVATLAENSLELLDFGFGAELLGAVDAMINTSYRGDFLTHQLRDCGAKALLVDPQLLEVAESVSADL